MIVDDAAMQAHARLAAALPCRRYSPLGIDALAMEQQGLRFRQATDPGAKVAIRELVMRALLELGGQATMQAIADRTGIRRENVKHAIGGMVERRMVERIDAHRGRAGLYRACVVWDE